MNEFKCALYVNGMEYDYFITEGKTEDSIRKYVENRFKKAFPFLTDQIITIEKCS